MKYVFVLKDGKELILPEGFFSDKDEQGRFILVTSFGWIDLYTICSDNEDCLSVKVYIQKYAKAGDRLFIRQQEGLWKTMVIRAIGSEKEVSPDDFGPIPNVIKGGT